MRKVHIAAILIAFSSTLVAAAPAGQTAEPTMAVALKTVVNMYSDPRPDVELVSQALLGDNVKVLKREKNAAGEDWVRIETPDTYQGWAAASSLRFLKPGDKPYAKSGKVFVVSGLMANIYRKTSVSSAAPVQIAPISAVLEVAGEKNDHWLELVLPDGVRAFVQKGDGDVHDGPWTWPRRTPDDMVALAKRFLGVTYLWGGDSPLGIDCSGFAQLIYKMNGVPILRDAGIQMTQSGLLEIPKGQQRTGDLIFFGDALDDIGHVGMMIDHEVFINATTYETPCVRIDTLTNPRWTKIFQAVRRPTEANAK